MNKKGFLDFDFDVESLVPIGFAILGAAVAYFTSIGGFSQAITGESYRAPIVTLIGAPIGGAVIGYIMGWWMVNR